MGGTGSGGVKKLTLPASRAVEKLRTYLRRQGLQSQHFADSIGISPAALSQYLSGKRAPGIEAAVLIEDATEAYVPIRAWLEAPQRPNQLG